MKKSQNRDQKCTDKKKIETNNSHIQPHFWTNSKKQHVLPTYTGRGHFRVWMPGAITLILKTTYPKFECEDTQQ